MQVIPNDIQEAIDKLGSFSSKFKANEIYQNLKLAREPLEQRGLDSAVEWIDTQITSLQESLPESGLNATPMDLKHSSQIDQKSENIFNKCMCLFRRKEYFRVFYTLEKTCVDQPDTPNVEKYRFLCLFSLFRFGQMKHQISNAQTRLEYMKNQKPSGSQEKVSNIVVDTPPTTLKENNQQFHKILSYFHKWYSIDLTHTSSVDSISFKHLKPLTDPHLLYLYGIVCFHLGKYKAGISACISSLDRFPWNWSCWLLLKRFVLPTFPGSNQVLGVEQDDLTGAIPTLDTVPFSDVLAGFPVFPLPFSSKSQHSTVETPVNLSLSDTNPSSFSSISNSTPNPQTSSSVLGVHSKFPSKKALSTAHLPRNWCTLFFQLDILVKSEKSHCAQAIASQCLQFFPNNLFLLNILAHSAYNLRDYEKSEKYFQQMAHCDPYYIDYYDTLSNIYFVTLQNEKLAQLMNKAKETCEFKCSSCIVFGNHYSRIGQHESALLYFSRALKINPEYAVAWTLIGHEFLEVSNPIAAIDAYRSALDLNPCDYRAWYALGQVYELLDESQYALYFYRKAAWIRPFDSRMWTAVGTLLTSLEQFQQAALCFRKAFQAGDDTLSALAYEAQAYRALKLLDKAERSYREQLAHLDSQDEQNDKISCLKLEPLTFLSTFYMIKQRTKESLALSQRVLLLVDSISNQDEFVKHSKQQAERVLQKLANIADSKQPMF